MLGVGCRVVSGAHAIALGDNQKLTGSSGSGAIDRPDLPSRAPMRRGQFLRVPPFPGAKFERFAEIDTVSFDVGDLAAQVRECRVGGTYWGAQPDLKSNLIIVRSSAGWPAAADLFGNDCIPLWDANDQLSDANLPIPIFGGDCDPWHVLSKASALITDFSDDYRVIAALLGVRRYLHDAASGQLRLDVVEAPRLIRHAFAGLSFANPFTGEGMSVAQAVELCAFWRQLIDSNRDLSGAIGFAFWKRSHVAPLLWGGARLPTFLRDTEKVAPGSQVAVWRSKAAPSSLADIDRKKIAVLEVEDGFLRSRGLGADCVPPLSITTDRLGPFFDPSRPSELEELLQHGTFDAPTLSRARKLREVIVAAGIGKYEHGSVALDRPAGSRRHILVPGQVEDDRSVQCGGCGLVSNLELVRRVRQQAPDAFILYKPHPDVTAGHRAGAIRNERCLQFADSIVSDASIASLISMVDEVHVNTSLAGFEALLRGKVVTTYGVPFYAGWGLTSDLGPVPQRRSTRRNIDELVAATLLIYPRYLDPLTGLPCPAEVVVARLAANEIPASGAIVGMRRLQGRLMRRLRSLVQ